MTRRILCYGDSNTWGYADSSEPPSHRYAKEIRWPGAMAAALGHEYEVIEEGLNGRTTDISEPDMLAGAGVNGASYLPACLASHLELDLVIILLGTNDLKARFNRSPLRIGAGAALLVDIAQTIGGGIGTPFESPDVMLVAPPPLGTMHHFSEEFAGGAAKAERLPVIYASIAAMAGISYFEAGTVIKSDAADGLHWSAAAHQKLGAAIADAVKHREQHRAEQRRNAEARARAEEAARANAQKA